MRLPESCHISGSGSGGGGGGVCVSGRWLDRRSKLPCLQFLEFPVLAPPPFSWLPPFSPFSIAKD